MERGLFVVALLSTVAACSAGHALDTTSSDAGATVADTAVANPAVADTAVANPAVADTSVGNPGVADTSVGNPPVADTVVADAGSATAPDGSTMSMPEASAPASACLVTCGTPPGPETPFTSDAQITKLMTGRWLICSGREIWAMVGAPHDVVGVEYTADGKMYYLVPGPGGPWRGAGFAYQLTYDASTTGQLNMHPAPNAGFFGTVSYSPCPRELQIAPLAYIGTGTTLVALDEEGTPSAPPIVAGPTCGSTCEMPAGTVLPFTSIDTVYATLEGRWLICTGLPEWQNGGAPSDVVGVEYGPASAAPTANGGTVGGAMYYLVRGPTGLVRGAGSHYQLTYDVSPGGSFQVNMHPAPNSGFGTSFRYSPCPRELEINGILVPAP